MYTDYEMQTTFLRCLTLSLSCCSSWITFMIKKKKKRRGGVIILMILIMVWEKSLGWCLFNPPHDVSDDRMVVSSIKWSAMITVFYLCYEKRSCSSIVINLHHLQLLSSSQKQHHPLFRRESQSSGWLWWCWWWWWWSTSASWSWIIIFKYHDSWPDALLIRNTCFPQHLSSPLKHESCMGKSVPPLFSVTTLSTSHFSIHPSVSSGLKMKLRFSLSPSPVLTMSIIFFFWLSKSSSSLSPSHLLNLPPQDASGSSSSSSFSQNLISPSLF